jgi:hypothetical protein
MKKYRSNKPKLTKEQDVQLVVSRYVQLKYPDVIFCSESSGVRLTMGQAKRLKAMRSVDCKLPDMLIFEPKGSYKGLFLELKREGEAVFQKDGVTPYAGHVSEQHKTLERLKAKGYKAEFAIGTNEAISIIDNYMNQ